MKRFHTISLVALAVWITLALAWFVQAQVTLPPLQNTALNGAFNTAPPTLSNGQFGLVQIDSLGNLKTTGGAPAAGSGNSGYPPGATPVNQTATGTTAGASVALPGVANKFTYVCGISISPGSASTAITLSYQLIGSGTFVQGFIGAPVTAVGVTGLEVFRTFTPCIPASAINTGITVTVGALGTGGVNQTVNIWGYQQ